MVPTIQNPNQLSLPADAQRILQAMFHGYQQVIIQHEFGGGRSGSHVFLVKPIKNRKVSELPTVIKMASVSLISREWSAYQSYILDKLPRAARIKNEPIVLHGSRWSALRYEMVGDGTFDIEQFSQYISYASPEISQTVVSGQLLKALGELWGLNWVHPGIPLRSIFDTVLPVNLLIAPQELPDETEPTSVTPDTVGQLPPLRAGDFVQLSGFIITKVDLLRHTVTLNLPQPAPRTTAIPGLSYQIRLKNLTDIGTYQFEQAISDFTGVIIETRSEKLRQEVQAVVPSGIDLTTNWLAATQTTPSVPNPFLRLPDLLSDIRRIRVGTIHGDLNLGNILVDKHTSYLHLIDFSEAREDYVLHDLLRFETELITHVVAPLIAKHHLPIATTIHSFYTHLYHLTPESVADVSKIRLPHKALLRPLTTLAAVRQAVPRYLFQFDDVAEYYQGLVIYLLSALKFRNLDPAAKSAAFWGAASIQQLLVEPPKPAGAPSLTPALSQIKMFALLALLLVALIPGVWLGWQWQGWPPSSLRPAAPVTATVMLPNQALALSLPTATDTATPTTTSTPLPTPLPPTETAVAVPIETATLASPISSTRTVTSVRRTVVVTPTHTVPPPTAAPSATPTPVVSSTALFYDPPFLISPSETVNLTEQQATFTWQWDGTLADNHGFELQIWLASEEQSFGAYDARETLRDAVRHDNGRYSLTFDLTAAHSVKLNGNSRDYLWTVAIVQIEPSYQDLGYKADPRPLEINVFHGGGSGGGNPEGGSSGGRPPGFPPDPK